MLTLFVIIRNHLLDDAIAASVAAEHKKNNPLTHVSANDVAEAIHLFVRDLFGCLHCR